MPTLRVRVISARNLPEGDFFVKIKVGDEVAKTEVQKKTTTPEWNETFEFSCKEDDAIQIELTQSKKLGSSKIGSATIGNVKEFQKGKERVSWEKGFDKNGELQLGVLPVDYGRSTEEKKAVDNAQQTLNKQQMLPPMPSAEEVNRLYNQLMETLGFDKTFKHPTQIQTKAMAEISLENKWAIVCSQKQMEAQKGSKKKIEDSPQYWASKLKAEPSHQLLRDLRIVLGGESLPWLHEFIEVGGLAQLIETLGVVEHNIHRRSATEGTLAKQDEQIQMQHECVRCLETLLNNKTGLQGVINTEGGLRKLVLCIDMPEEWRLRVLKILTVLSLMGSDGHRLVIDGFTYFRQVKKEKTRFETLLKHFDAAPSVENSTLYLTFINAIINSPNDIDLRLALRNEFNKLGIENIIKRLKDQLAKENDVDLETQIDTFEEEGKDDFKELTERFQDLDININNVDEVFKALKEQARKNGIAQNFLGALQNLLIMTLKSSDLQKGIAGFLLACRIIRQISLNKETIGATDENQIQLKELMISVESEANQAPLNKKIEELSEELDKMSRRIETSQIELKEKDERIRALKDELTGIASQLSVSQQNLQAALAASGTGAPPVLIPNPGAPSGAPPPPGGPDVPPPPGGVPPPPGAPDIPPPPGMGLPPPPGGPPPPPGMGPPPPPGGPPPPPGMGPPPPPGMGPPPPPGMGFAAPPKVVKKKPRKTPAAKLKGPQWVKLPDNKIKGTVFEKFSEEYKGVQLDYKELEDLFAQKVIEKKEDTEEKSKKQPIMQFVENKTSQAISLILAQFKNVPLSDIALSIQMGNMKMFTSEQVKQLSMNIPSKDDVSAIQGFLKDGGDESRLPPPDKFALELDKVPNVDIRLKALNFRFEYEPKKADIKPGIEALKKASLEIANSKRFPELLELILEVGNFLNEGTPRAGVFGFKISSLPKLADTKTTDNSFTLLQIISKILEHKAPHLLKFAEELPTVESAMRTSLQALQADVASLQKDFTTVEKALAGWEKDKFVDSMKPFLDKVRDEVEQINQSMTIMQDKYNTAVSLYGEDPKTMQPEEFFNYFVSFTKSIEDAVKANEQAVINAEKNKRREEAKVKRDAELKQKAAAPGKPGAPGQDNVVDELFGALKGGNYFKNRRQQNAKDSAAPAPAPGLATSSSAPPPSTPPKPTGGFKLPPPAVKKTG